MATDLLPFEELWPRIAAEVSPVNSEFVTVNEANGRILRSAPCARWDLPMADNSAMDGFAVRTGDIVTLPTTLQPAIGNAYAGSAEIPTLRHGTYVPIGTGGLIPPGADAVVPKENVTRHTKTISVEKTVGFGDHIRHQGEELNKGDTIVDAGHHLDPLSLAALTMAGITEVEVNRRPVIKVLTSGNEIVSAGEPIRAGQVVDSNGPFLRSSLAKIIGTMPTQSPVVGDTVPALEAAFSDTLEGSDLVIITGGVSVGDRDLVKFVLERSFGVRRLVWRVAQKPGKPVYIGRRDTSWVLGLPGNPGAVAAMFTAIVQPLVLALMGSATAKPQRIPVLLGASLVPNRNRTHLRWATSEWNDQNLVATALKRSASHMLSDFARAQLLLVVPPGPDELPAGTLLEAMAIHR